MLHIPVLGKEVLEIFNPKLNDNFIDCTVGEGGHATLILEKNTPNGKVLGIDMDAGQIEKAANNTVKFGNRIILVNDSYANLTEIVKKAGLDPVNGILLDLGMSSVHLEESGRGFSFLRDELLDMRFGAEVANYKLRFPDLTAEKIVNEYSREKLEEIFRRYGEEKFSRKIADAISERRKTGKIKSTFELVKIIKEAIPLRYRLGKIHFATRIFQAIRIAVNGELDNLEKFLPQAVDVLSIGGRLVVISFHSMEDRIVKNFFKEKNKEKTMEIINKKPITAGSDEISANKRSRSAKLRAAKKI